MTKLQFFGNPSDNCLLVVGGYGDTVKVFQPLLRVLSETITTHQICSFDLTFDDDINVLEIQANELKDAVTQLNNNPNIKKISIWCTSMGAYSTTMLITSDDVCTKLQKVIFFDPADYLMSATSDETWSGFEEYEPTSPVVSDLLSNLSASTIIDVVHLTLRNHSEDGYIAQDYSDRGKDNSGAFPRLNSDMIKAHWDKIPPTNKGKYLEIDNIPHGFIRDGNVSQNLQDIAQISKKLLLETPN